MYEMKNPRKEMLMSKVHDCISAYRNYSYSYYDNAKILKKTLDNLFPLIKELGAEQDSLIEILEILNTTIGNKTVLHHMLDFFSFEKVTHVIDILITQGITGPQLLDLFVKKEWYGGTPLASILVNHYDKAPTLLNILIKNGAPIQKLLESFKIRIDNNGMTAFMVLARYHNPKKLLSLVGNLRELIMQDISVLTPIIIGKVKFSEKETFFHDFVIPVLYTLNELPDDILAYFRSEQGKSVLRKMLKTYQPSPEVMGIIRDNINDIKTPLGSIVNFHRPIIGIGEVKLDPNNPKTWTKTYKELNAKFGLSTAISYCQQAPGRESFFRKNHQQVKVATKMETPESLSLIPRK